jgi:hypothetical protein
MIDSVITISRLDRASLDKYLLVALALEKSSGLPPWEAEHFLMELPEKWMHSCWFFHRDAAEPVGYAVISRKPDDSLHIHRFVVAPTNQGYGAYALRCVIESLRGKTQLLTVTTLPESNDARRFYVRHGFSEHNQVSENVMLAMQL